MGGALAVLLRDIVLGLESVLFPSRCRACGAELDGRARLLCPTCRDDMTAPLPGDWREACLLGGGDGPRFAPRPYDGPAGEAVRLLKFGGKKRMAPLLAEAVGPLAAALKERYQLDTLVPVPLHPRRRRERRFNQAEEIGSLVAAAVGLEFRRRGLARTKYTRPQVELTGKERRTNVRGAFAAREDFSGKGVLLLDDVITTGATVRECAAVLRNAGAGAVVALAAAGAGL
ncbi:MAG TPA: ComF family protein [bacterium]|nr:ComF family protein [bacterium]